MADEINFIQDAKGADKTAETTQARVRSTIEFPYNDQDQAVSVARKIHDHAGMECTVEQLSGWFRQPPTSGSFRQRISTARTFGFIETGRGGDILLTSLGREVVDPEQEQEARARAFMLVPLYKELFNKFKRYTLPTTKAMEREIMQLGVTPKQADRARRAFERSASQAGYFEQGNDRLVSPAFNGSPDTKPLSEPKDRTDDTSVRLKIE